MPGGAARNLIRLDDSLVLGSRKQHVSEAALSVFRFAAVAALIAAAGLALLVWRGEEPAGIDDVYVLAFGPADLGEVDFTRLRRSGAPNDALACNPEVCPSVAIDVETSVYPVPGARLREIVREAMAARPRTEPVFAARWEEADRYVERSALMRYPDTINVRIFGAGQGRSMLALYSRSQIGYSDLGVNRARIDAILADVAARVAREPQP